MLVDEIKKTFRNECRSLEVLDYFITECECGEALGNLAIPLAKDEMGNEIWECERCGKRWKVSPKASPDKQKLT